MDLFNTPDKKLQQDLQGLLAIHGVCTSLALQTRTGKSQATVARALLGLGDKVIQLGAARSTRYALANPIFHWRASQPLFVTDVEGNTSQWGMLHSLHSNQLYVQSALGYAALTQDSFPWFLTPLRLQGFLGKLRGRVMGYSEANPERWSLQQMLYALITHEADSHGAFSLGEQRGEVGVSAVSDNEYTRLERFDEIARDVSRTLSAGSSAGGEQPKFIVQLHANQGGIAASSIVKFTPPRGTPYGERWHDLLHAECTALEVLQAHGYQVAQARVLCSDVRTYLECIRFDRIHHTNRKTGKRHVVSIDAVHREFVKEPKRNWVHSCNALAKLGLLNAQDAHTAAIIFEFGNHIGNTDMHFGNLSFFVKDHRQLSKPELALAPVYDMLPMRYRPGDFSDGMGYSAFALPDYARGAYSGSTPAQLDAAKALALVFWKRMKVHDQVSKSFRALAKEMLTRF